MKIGKRIIYITLLAFISGFLLIIQSRSYEMATNTLVRDKTSSIFQELKILKDKNDDLRSEVEKLEETMNQLRNQDSALEAIAEEIEKYRKLSGDFPISGPGLKINLDGDITVPWVVDLINEIYNAGAEAVSINEIRIVNQTAGFEVLPQGQILINGSIITPPLEINAIGESTKISESLEASGGIFDRLELAIPKLKIKVERLDQIDMN